MKALTIILTLFICISVIGCKGRKPTMQELTGKWVHDDSTMIQLNANGTFIARSLPTEQLLSVFAKDTCLKIFDGQGTWQIKESRSSWDQLPWSLLLSFVKSTNSNNKFEARIIISGSNFIENKPPWKSIFIWNEEEGGERYEFTRSK